MPRFTITTACWLDRSARENLRQPRYEMFLRCINSVASQTFRDFEWVIADDMSIPSVQEIIDASPQLEGISVTVVRLPEKVGRIGAINAAMKEAKGDWIVQLDSDDELASIYLEAFNDAIRVYPDYDIFSSNHLVFHFGYETEIRKFINMEVQGDKPFGSGNIGTGAFVFKRSVAEEIGPMPELGLWQFAGSALEEFPEIKPFFESHEHPGQYNSLGNPWGNDFYLFYKLTRNRKTKYLDTALYIVHSRFNHRWKDDPQKEEDNPGSKPEWNKDNV